MKNSAEEMGRKSVVDLYARYERKHTCDRGLSRVSILDRKETIGVICYDFVGSIKVSI